MDRAGTPPKREIQRRPSKLPISPRKTLWALPKLAIFEAPKVPTERLKRTLWALTTEVNRAVWPAMVRIGSGGRPVGDGITEGHHRSGVRRRVYHDAA